MQNPYDTVNIENRDWHAEMHRRRLQRLLSTSLFLCFLILFFDTNPKRRPYHYGSKENSIASKSKEYDESIQLLYNALGNDTLQPFNVSGIFAGNF